jgi:hypothetical protein
MVSETTIVRERQLVIRRELDRRGISLKSVSFDSGIPYASIVSYFPGERDRQPAAIPAPAVFAIAKGNAIPLDLLSLVLPDGFQIIRAPESIDHDLLADAVTDYLAEKQRCHHPESECGPAIGPGEKARLDSKVTSLVGSIAA